VSYWLARIIVGVFVAIGVAVLTFCFAWWHLSPSDDDLSMSFKIAGVVGGIFGLLVIVMGADILSVIDAVFFGGTRRR
jgi:cytochrome bd-type quinol oxidase subunit 1